MQPSSAQDYKQLLTEVIKKQIVILGPDITLSKARNVKGLTVADDGTVTSVEGQPQEVTQALIDQFVQLSGLIVKKTMEPLLSLSEPTQPVAQPTSAPAAQAAQPIAPAPAANPLAATPPQTTPPMQASTPTASMPTAQTTPTPSAIPDPGASNAQQAINSALSQTPPVPPGSTSAQAPAKNPLAA